MDNYIGFLKFQPIFEYRLWAGDKLSKSLGKKCKPKTGESWEISGVNQKETKIISGNHKGKTLTSVINSFKEEIVGKHCYLDFGNQFPILIKFIDTDAPLSIQVHPNDTVAKRKHNSLGKNEMWYVLATEKDAELSIGFSEAVTPEICKEAIRNGNFPKLVNKITPNKGDLFYIPSGRVHAIGKGVLLAEIQQTSDVTYRIYDYDRIDSKTGRKRELHIDDALESLDYNQLTQCKTEYDTELNSVNKMVHTNDFSTNFIKCDKPLNLNFESKQSFKIYICTAGEGTLADSREKILVKYGETIMLPANEKNLRIIPNKSIELIEVSY